MKSQLLGFMPGTSALDDNVCVLHWMETKMSNGFKSNKKVSVSTMEVMSHAVR